jgi:hypothetical protein
VAAAASTCALAGPAEAFEPRVPETFFGVSAPHMLELAKQGDEAALNLHAQGMHEAGLDWARVTIDWRVVEPLLGVGGLHVYTWGAVDRLVESLARNGLALMPNVYGTPFWARDLEAALAGCTGNAAVATAHIASYAHYVSALINRYGPDGSFWAAHPDIPSHPVETVELWNEPNWTGYWCPRPDPVRYAQLLGAGARAAKVADPSVEVALGGLVLIKETLTHADGAIRGAETGAFLEQLLATDPALPDWIDSIGIHLYEPDVDSNLSLLGWLRSRLAQVGLGDADLLVTEFGWRTGGPPEGAISEAIRAERVRALTTELPRTDCGVSGVAIHDWANLRTDPANIDHWFSIVDLATAEPFPTADAYEEVVDLYEGRGPTPAPREVTPVCGEEPPDQDEDGVPDPTDDFPLDPERAEGGNEPPPPDPTPDPEEPTRTPRAAADFFTVANAYMPDDLEARVPHYDEMARLGVRSVDETVEWGDVQPALPGPDGTGLRWADFDRRILSYARRAIAAKLSFTRAPGWVPGSASGAGQAYADFMRAVAARYGSQGSFWDENRHLDSGLAVRDFGVWSAANTPAGAWDGTPSPAEYADTYVRVRGAVHGADPQGRAIASLNDFGAAGAADDFLRDMVTARPELRGGLDGVYVLSSARTVGAFEDMVARVRTALDQTGNGDARLYMGFGAPVAGPGALTEAQRAAFFTQVADRAPRLDCGVSGITLSSWTSKQADLANPWDWYGISHLAYAAAWPSAEAYLGVARAFTGYGTQEPPRPALHPCFRDAPDADGDGAADSVDPDPLDPSNSTPQAEPPPAPEFDTAPAEFSNVTRPSFSYVAAGAEGFQCRLDGGGWTACGAQHALSWLPDGSHAFETRGVSAAGLVGPVARHAWTIDTRLPDTSITSGPSGVVQTEDVEFRVAGDEPASRYACRFDDAAWSWCDATVRYTGLADGLHRFRAMVVDRAGNSDPDPVYREFTVRAVPDRPALTADGITTQTPTFRFEAAYAASFQCQFDQDPWAACSSAASHTPSRPLRDGSHRFGVRGVGATGKPGPASTWTFTVDDTKAPETSIVAGPEGSVPTGPVTFRLGSDEDGVAFWCKLDSEAWGQCDAVVTYSELAEGSHRFQAAAVDPGGNGDPTPVIRDFSLVAPIPDVTPPEVTIRPLKRARGRTAIFAIEVVEQESAVASVRCKLDAERWRSCADGLELRRLKPGRHLVRAEASDASGNLGSDRHVWRIRR